VNHITILWLVILKLKGPVHLQVWLPLKNNHTNNKSKICMTHFSFILPFLHNRSKTALEKRRVAGANGSPLSDRGFFLHICLSLAKQEISGTICWRLWKANRRLNRLWTSLFQINPSGVFIQSFDSRSSSATN